MSQRANQDVFGSVRTKTSIEKVGGCRLTCRRTLSKKKGKQRREKLKTCHGCVPERKKKQRKLPGGFRFAEVGKNDQTNKPKNNKKKKSEITTTGGNKRFQERKHHMHARRCRLRGLANQNQSRSRTLTCLAKRSTAENSAKPQKRAVGRKARKEDKSHKSVVAGNGSTGNLQGLVAGTSGRQDPRHSTGVRVIVVVIQLNDSDKLYGEIVQGQVKAREDLAVRKN